MSQFFQMAGVMMQASKKGARKAAAVVEFLSRPFMQALERLIPQGATEVTNALWTGNAYAPPVLHSPDQGNVHGTAPAQQQAQAAAATPSPATPPQPATGWGEQVPMGHRQIGYSDNAKIIDMQPQLESRKKDEFQKLLDSAAAAQPDNSQKQARGRKA